MDKSMLVNLEDNVCLIGTVFNGRYKGANPSLHVIVLPDFRISKSLVDHSKTCNSFHVSTFGSKHDNFIGIRVVSFLNTCSIFISSMDISRIFVVCILFI